MTLRTLLVTRRHRAAVAAALILLGAASGAAAEHADRTKQIAVTATDAVADQARQTAEFSGDVVVVQGSMEIRADRVQMRAGANGERLGIALGKAGAPVRFRQRGDRPDEWNEGQADRVEYDSTANEVRLIGAATLRNLNGGTLTQAVTSDAITYDTARDRVSSTAAEQPRDGRPRQRVTVVFAPRATAAPDPASP
jgi:lipopolysaccharide export system protein LptA